MAASILTQAVSGAGLSCLRRRTGLRCLSAPAGWGKRQGQQVRKEPPEIPGLERITYADRMYYLPWLARPRFPDFKKDWSDPFHYRAPAPEEMKLYKERPSFVFQRSCRLLGGVKQALWLTKTKMIEGLPQKILSICENPDYQFPNHEELVHNTIAQACLWSNTEEQPIREEYCPKLLQGLLHLCRTQNSKFPALSERSMVENCRLSTYWQRGSDTFHVRGISGFLLNAKAPLSPLASESEIQDTVPHKLESLYPISPAIDLQEVNVYKNHNDLGFKEGYPFPDPHTIFIMDPCSTKARFLPDQLRAKMIMLAFGSALAKAKILNGEESKVLKQPVYVQGIATDGQLFHFVAFQLNTLDLESDDGVKNLVWIDADQPLYDTAFRVPQMKRKVVLAPAGVSGLRPETFRKFWAMYLHGAV
ncbi:39S ribosomal protein L37, mitochondrial [Spea bombifrons]|uniref:39S ribosomal protein L37, mitochondrial n=1 Tax=Spea bombifrons TaxID=233779 RepID=UPI0023490670|nr:39S ribosomal protein L37, mitochondrial [Spea bombifrons]